MSCKLYIQLQRRPCTPSLVRSLTKDISMNVLMSSLTICPQARRYLTDHLPVPAESSLPDRLKQLASGKKKALRKILIDGPEEAALGLESLMSLNTTCRGGKRVITDAGKNVSSAYSFLILCLIR